MYPFKMKVLFLDIDGVCNSATYMLAIKKKSFWLDTDPEAVKLVRRIIKETDCKVVLSSTWRLYEKAREAVRRDVCRYIDTTIDMQRGSKRGIVPRGEEVQEWLSRHHEVSQYAIIDDDADFLPHQWLFKTTWEKGLTPEIAEAVICHLNACDNTIA